MGGTQYTKGKKYKENAKQQAQKKEFYKQMNLREDEIDRGRYGLMLGNNLEIRTPGSNSRKSRVNNNESEKDVIRIMDNDRFKTNQTNIFISKTIMFKFMTKIMNAIEEDVDLRKVFYATMEE